MNIVCSSSSQLSLRLEVDSSTTCTLKTIGVKWSWNSTWKWSQCKAKNSAFNVNVRKAAHGITNAVVKTLLDNWLVSYRICKRRFEETHTQMQDCMYFFSLFCLVNSDVFSLYINAWNCIRSSLYQSFSFALSLSVFLSVSDRNNFRIYLSNIVLCIFFWLSIVKSNQFFFFPPTLSSSFNEIWTINICTLVFV